MRLDSLNHIADAGIATNLAFSVLDGYRGWLREQITKKVDRTASSLTNALIEAPTRGNAERPTKRIQAIATELGDRNVVVQRFFTYVAVFFAIALALFLMCAAVHAEAECTLLSPWNWAIVIMALGVAPTLLCWLVMWSQYLWADHKLSDERKKYQHYVDVNKEFQAGSLKPTDPGAPPLPPPPPQAPPGLRGPQ